MDIFLKIDGIRGESQDVRHTGEIELESFSWSETAATWPGGSGSGGGGRVQMEAFGVTMGVSRASPELFLAVAKGAHFKSAVLSVRHPGSTDDFLKWTLSDIVVSAYRTSDVAGANRVTDGIILLFGKIEIEYHETTASGGLGPPIKAGWDVAGNRAI